jgi:hypothetical protein
MILEAIPSSEKETNPWVSAEARFDEAAELLGLDEGLRKILRSAALELKVSIPVMLDDGRYEVFTTPSCAALPRVVFVSRRTSRWTKCARWRLG